MPNSQLAVFADGSHMTFWEETDRYLEVVDAFLRSV
jgi:pimeloyl-ACP methyl ester carboxylesterase